MLLQEEQKVDIEKFPKLSARFSKDLIFHRYRLQRTFDKQQRFFVINFVNEDCEMMLTKHKVISLFRHYYSLSLEITKRKVFVYARLLRLQQTCDTQNMN